MMVSVLWIIYLLTKSFVLCKNVWKYVLSDTDSVSYQYIITDIDTVSY